MLFQDKIVLLVFGFFRKLCSSQYRFEFFFFRSKENKRDEDKFCIVPVWLLTGLGST